MGYRILGCRMVLNATTDLLGNFRQVFVLSEPPSTWPMGIIELLCG